MDFTDPIGMITRGVTDLMKLREETRKSNLDFLARFEKASAWDGDDWRYTDFLTAPKELENLRSQSLSDRDVKRRIDALMAKDAASKTPLIREIETGPREGMADRVRDMVAAGADPNGASLLKDTPLGFARYHGYPEVFDVLIELGADGEKAGFGPLHHAARYGTLADVQPLLNDHDPLWHHFDVGSPLREAVRAGKPDIVTAMLDHAASRNRLEDEEVATCLGIAVEAGMADLVRPFLQKGLEGNIALDSTLFTYDTAMLKLLIENGADVHQLSDLVFVEDPTAILDADGAPAIRAYVKTLLAAGWRIEDLDEFEHGQIRYVTEAYLLPAQDISTPDFIERADDCAGAANPEERTLPYHLEMLRTGESTYLARQRMPGLPTPAWTADRFGQSTTPLPDGRWVQIGGEHEDFYDPDFVIFSDVVVHTPGKGARVFFYPASVFPPTDFHTATRIRDAIWIVGGLGYMGDRQEGMSMVHRLDLTDFAIERVETSGAGPGWISRHTATEADGVITVSGGELWTGRTLTANTGRFALNTADATWTRLG